MDKKNFRVSLDVTLSVDVYVDAKNEEMAKIKAKNFLADDPNYYIKDGYIISSKVTDVNEEN